MIAHQIYIVSETTSRCRKCGQGCFSSLELFTNQIDPEKSSIGHCVALNDQEINLMSMKTGEFLKHYPCKISDEDFLVREIIT